VLKQAAALQGDEFGIAWSGAYQVDLAGLVHP
jgi:hypothetical protein